MITQHQFGSTDTQFRHIPAAELRAQPRQRVEERLHVGVEFFACRRQPKRRAVKELYTELLLQFADLAADRGLLNPVGNRPHRRADSAVRRHVIEQLKMVHIHRA